MPELSRRRLLALTGAAIVPLRAAAGIPVGLMLFSVHEELARDLPGTLRAVAKMGYQGVEFFGPYFDWTPAFAKEVRTHLDDLHLSCFSTHNESPAFTESGLGLAMELNRILGSRNIVCVRGLATPGGGPASPAAKGFPGAGLDGWQRMGEQLEQASERLGAAGMACAFHNHAIEFKPVNGVRPIDILARNRRLLFHLDVGPCRESGVDPVAFIQQYPGRTQAVLCSDWPHDASGHPPLLGQGPAEWKQIFAAAESTGGVRFYLIQQEGSAEPPLTAAETDLQNFRQLHRSR